MSNNELEIVLYSYEGTSHIFERKLILLSLIIKDNKPYLYDQSALLTTNGQTDVEENYNELDNQYFNYTSLRDFELYIENKYHLQLDEALFLNNNELMDLFIDQGNDECLNKLLEVYNDYENDIKEELHSDYERKQYIHILRCKIPVLNKLNRDILETAHKINEVIDTLHKDEIDFYICDWYDYLGDYYFSIKDYENAFKQYEKIHKYSLLIYDANHLNYEDKPVGINYQKMADTSYLLERYKDAIYYYQKSILCFNLSEEINDKLVVASLYKDLGFTYEKDNRVSNAIIAYEKEASLYDDLIRKYNVDVKKEHIDALDRVASCYENQGSYNAIKYYLISLEHLKSIYNNDYSIEIAYTYHKLSALYEKFEEDSHAIKMKIEELNILKNRYNQSHLEEQLLTKAICQGELTTLYKTIDDKDNTINSVLIEYNDFKELYLRNKEDINIENYHYAFSNLNDVYELYSFDESLFISLCKERIQLIDDIDKCNEVIIILLRIYIDNNEKDNAFDIVKLFNENTSDEILLKYYECLSLLYKDDFKIYENLCLKYNNLAKELLEENNTNEYRIFYTLGLCRLGELYYDHNHDLYELLDIFTKAKDHSDLIKDYLHIETVNNIDHYLAIIYCSIGEVERKVGPIKKALSIVNSSTINKEVKDTLKSRMTLKLYDVYNEKNLKNKEMYLKEALQLSKECFQKYNDDEVYLCALNECIKCFKNNDEYIKEYNRVCEEKGL